MKKYRDRTGLYLVDGRKLVEEALAAGLCEMIIVRDDYQIDMEHRGNDFTFIRGSLFNKIAQTETSQGIMAVVRKRDVDEEAFLSLISRGSGNVVVLDRLQDPGNIGTIIRTADAAGYDGVIAVRGTGDVYSPKTVRAAMGSVMRIPVYLTEDASQCVETLRRAGKKIVGTDIDAKVNYFDEDMTENTAVVIGNEGAGMSEEFRNGSDVNVKIPMTGAVDSLNAAVAAGILIYQSVEKR